MHNGVGMTELGLNNFRSLQVKLGVYTKPDLLPPTGSNLAEGSTGSTKSRFDYILHEQGYVLRLAPMDCHPAEGSSVTGLLRENLENRGR